MRRNALLFGALAAAAVYLYAQAAGATVNPFAVLGFSGEGDDRSAAPTAGDETANLLETIGTGMGLVQWKETGDFHMYGTLIAQVESANNIPMDLLGRLLYQESRYRPEIIDGRVRSRVGALGIAQFMPATARELGIDPLDPLQAIPAAGRYLAQLAQTTGSWSLALAAYNWGIGNVTRKGFNAAPAETKKYVAQITSDVRVA